jgi:hypothetical protein
MVSKINGQAKKEMCVNKLINKWKAAVLGILCKKDSEKK